MHYTNKFLYIPGGEQDPGSTAPRNDEDTEQNDLPLHEGEAGKGDKTIKDKIKDALKDWAEKDEADQEFDDTRV